MAAKCKDMEGNSHGLSSIYLAERTEETPKFSIRIAGILPEI